MVKFSATQLVTFFFEPDKIFRYANLREDKVDTHAIAVTGPSRNEGKNSPRYSAGNSSPILGKSSGQQPWVPSIRLRRDVSSSLDRNEITFRTVRSILNKLTPENFSKLSVSLLNVGISSKVILKGIVILIFDKSIDELRYSTLYANLCYRLYHEAPNFDPPPSQPLNGPHHSTHRPNTFRRLLIAKLQDEFENRNKKLEAFDSKVGPLDADEEEQRILSKRHMLGNIKFIGELYRLGVLHESIMHKCVKQLISKKKKGTMADLTEDLECLTQIMTTCGKRLDHPKAKCLMDQYFGRMEVLPKKQPDLPSRIRFMLQDVVKLRRNNWNPRRAQRDSGPRTLSQIRQEVEEMYPSNPYHIDDCRSNYDHSPKFSARRFPEEFQPSARGERDHSPGHFIKAIPPPNTEGSSGHQDNNSRSFDFFDSVQPCSGLPSSGGTKPRQNVDRVGATVTNGYHSENNYGKLTSNLKIKAATSKHVSNDRYNSISYKSSPPTPRSRPLFSKLDSNGLSSNGRQTRPHPIDDAIPVQRGWKQQQNRHSPTIRQTNVDAIQAPFHQTPLGKKAVVNGYLEKSSSKKVTLSKSDVREITEEMISEFLDSKKSLEETGKFVSELKMQRKLLLTLVSHILFISLSKSGEEKSRVVSLFNYFITMKVIKKEIFAEGVHLMIDEISEKESDITGIKSSTASLVALLLVEELTSLREVADPLTGGVLFPLFLLILKQVSKLKSEEALVEVFKDSNIDMAKMLPEASQEKESMVAILEGKQLLFLFPLAEIELKLTNQISQNASPTSIYKWVKENVNSDLHTNPEFVNVLVSCCLEHVTRNSSLSAEYPINLPKEVKEKERHLLSEIKPVLRKFLDENHKLQLHALYAAQVFCHNKGFPKGLLLRLFNSMYEDDIIDEEVFFSWKEDMNDSYPGKGKALFQVNTWLKWLHEAETDDED